MPAVSDCLNEVIQRNAGVGCRGRTAIIESLATAHLLWRVAAQGGIACLTETAASPHCGRRSPVHPDLRRLDIAAEDALVCPKAERPGVSRAFP